MYDKKNLEKAKNENNTPDKEISAKKAFGIDSELSVPAFSKKTDNVPKIDKAYYFDPETPSTSFITLLYLPSGYIQASL